MKHHSNILPILSHIVADRQIAKRHYGVHPYFTRRPSNVVRDYILHYTNPNDKVLDPFGGSGVTAIEAFLENRIGIQNDINPLANFIANGIVDLSKGNLSEYNDAINLIKRDCTPILNKIVSSEQINLDNYKHLCNLPKNIQLPSNSDVPFYFELFTPRQLISLCVIKESIDKLQNNYVRSGMLLAWSATLTKLNKTFLSAKNRVASRGGSSIFSIYRYKVAKAPIELLPWETYYERALNIIAAKNEIDRQIELKKKTPGGWNGKYKSYSYDIEKLAVKFENSIDYIFTDPPYGGHINYLDLSTLWINWLNLKLNDDTRKKELIVGGELGLSEERYIKRLNDSVRSCIKMLKDNRWLSIVFQHWNTRYFKAILTGCAEEGAELKAAISQVGDPIWSMHKKKNRETVLAGELILTFFKSNKLIKLKDDKIFDLEKALNTILYSYSKNLIYGEYLFNRLIIEAWQQSAIGSFEIKREEFLDLMDALGWGYDGKHHYWVKGADSEDQYQLFND